jgi:copper chaperone CopZ
MTCEHCASTVKAAINTIDSDATTVVNLAGRSVSVDTKRPATAVSEAILAAGYSNKQKEI